MLFSDIFAIMTVIKLASRQDKEYKYNNYDAKPDLTL